MRHWLIRIVHLMSVRVSAVRDAIILFTLLALSILFCSVPRHFFKYETLLQRRTWRSAVVPFDSILPQLDKKNITNENIFHIWMNKMLRKMIPIDAKRFIYDEIRFLDIPMIPKPIYPHKSSLHGYENRWLKINEMNRI